MNKSVFKNIDSESEKYDESKSGCSTADEGELDYHSDAARQECCSSVDEEFLHHDIIDIR